MPKTRWKRKPTNLFIGCPERRSWTYAEPTEIADSKKKNRIRVVCYAEHARTRTRPLAHIALLIYIALNTHTHHTQTHARIGIVTHIIKYAHQTRAWYTFGLNAHRIAFYLELAGLTAQRHSKHVHGIKSTISHTYTYIPFLIFQL